MGNCLKTMLKESVSIENPEYLGFVKIYVQNNGSSAAGIKNFTASGRSNYFPVGSYTLGSDVFSTGKNIVEQGDNAQIPANSAFYVFVPKYVNFIVPLGNNGDTVASTQSNATYKFEDFDFDLTAGNIGASGTSVLVFGPTPDGHHFSGNFECVVKYIVNGNDTLIITDPDIVLDLDNSELYKRGILRMQTVFINASKVTGNLEGFISKLIQYRKAEAKTTSGDKRLAIYNSGITSLYFNPNTDSSVMVHFNGTASITITQGSTTVNYNIDTDTFSI